MLDGFKFKMIDYHRNCFESFGVLGRILKFIRLAVRSFFAGHGCL